MSSRVCLGVVDGEFTGGKSTIVRMLGSEIPSVRIRNLEGAKVRTAMARLLCLSFYGRTVVIRVVV